MACLANEHILLNVAFETLNDFHDSFFHFSNFSLVASYSDFILKWVCYLTDLEINSVTDFNDYK